MYPRVNAPSDFDYPADRLLKLRGILSAEEIRKPNNRNHKNEPMRYVIKRGLTTLTTIGCLTGFDSHVRRYFALGTRNSVEAAIYPYNDDFCPFSKGGDFGGRLGADLRGGGFAVEYPGHELLEHREEHWGDLLFAAHHAGQVDDAVLGPRFESLVHGGAVADAEELGSALHDVRDHQRRQSLCRPR